MDLDHFDKRDLLAIAIGVATLLSGACEPGVKRSVEGRESEQSEKPTVGEFFLQRRDAFESLRVAAAAIDGCDSFFDECRRSPDRKYGRSMTTEEKAKLGAVMRSAGVTGVMWGGSGSLTFAIDRELIESYSLSVGIGIAYSAASRPEDRFDSSRVGPSRQGRVVLRYSEIAHPWYISRSYR